MSGRISVISLIFGLIGFCCGFIFGPIAIVLGVIGIRRDEERGVAVAGLVLGISSIICWIFAFIFFWTFIVRYMLFSPFIGFM